MLTTRSSQFSTELTAQSVSDSSFFAPIAGLTASAALPDTVPTSFSGRASFAAASAVPMSPGSTLPTAENLGILAGRQVVSDTVSLSNELDIYRFQLTSASDLNLTLAGLTANADLFLIRDFNNDGLVTVSNEVLDLSANSGTTPDAITAQNLAAGTYYAAVLSDRTFTNYTLTLTSDAVGNTLNTARNLGTLGSSTLSLRDYVGADDLDDYYRFELNRPSSLNLSLTGMTADADIYLIQDVNFNGVVEAGEVLDYSIAANATSESIAISGLTAGTYYIGVLQYQGNTNYLLQATATPIDVGGTLATAAQIGVLAGQRSFFGNVSTNDAADYYRFQLNAPSDLAVTLTGMTNDADVYLIRDLNNNGLVDTGETLGQSLRSGTQSELINLNNLAAGTYFVRVDQFSGGTNYTLMLTADAAGETLSTARNIGILNSSRSYRDFVGTIDAASNTVDLDDVYRFSLSTTSNVTLNLTGLSADADLYLIRDFNNNGVVETAELLSRSILSGTANESITRTGLLAGNYFVLVAQVSGSTNYTLNLETTAVLGLQMLSGSLGADTFTINPTIAQTIVMGNGNVDFGQGRRDVIDLSNLLSTSISLNLLGLNGLGVAYDPGNGTRMFDAINFSDGRQILFEGIDRILFADRVINLSVTPNDPLFSQQWNLHMMGVHNAWRFTTGSTNVAVGIQDTGLGVDSLGTIHPDLRVDNLFYRGPGNYRDDFFRNVPGGSGVRTSSHGTAVQGIIAAASNNGIGLSGINWNSTVLTSDVLDNNPGDLPLSQATREMINFALSRGQRLVINMSLGGGAIDPALEQLVAQYQDSVLFVIAAGNDDRNGISNPAALAQRYRNVIAVGAVWGRDDRFGNPRVPGTRISYPGSWGSNYGWGLSLMGPSEVVTTEANRGSLGVTFDIESDFNGTSAAAPNVAGVASLVWSANPNLTATQVYQILADTASDLGIPGYDLVTGHGFVNADAAVRRAIALNSTQMSVIS
jgi:hypothetical protein